MDDTAATLADRRLEWLLEEALSGRACPDLSAAVLERVARTAELEAPQSRRWAAALLILGAAIVGTVLALRRPSTDGSAQDPGPEPQRVRSAADIERLPRDTTSVVGINVVDADLAPLPRLTSLHTLDLSRREEDAAGDWPPVRITDAGLVHVAKCTSLRTLNLSDATEITAHGLRTLAALPHLEHLVLRNRVDGAALRELSTYPALRIVDASWCFEVAPHDFATLADCPKLEVLRLAGCHQLGAEHLAFLQSMTKLRVLDLAELDGRTRGGGHLQRTHPADGIGVTDRVVAQVAALPALEALWLSGCRAITDASMRSLARCRSLRELRVGARTEVTAEGLDALRTLELTSLHLERAQHISESAARSWADAVGHCRVVLPSGTVVEPSRSR